MALFLLTSCTISGEEPKQNIAPTRNETIKGAVPIDQMREMAATANNDEIDDVEVTAIRAMNKNYLDMKADTMLFVQPINDSDKRFDRLESAVQNINDDLGKLAPSINRLIAIETDIKELHDKLVTLIDNKSNSTQTFVEPKVVSLKNKQLAFDDVAAMEDEELLKDDVTNEFLPALPKETELIDAEEIILEIEKPAETIETKLVITPVPEPPQENKSVVTEKSTTETPKPAGLANAKPTVSPNTESSEQIKLIAKENTVSKPEKKTPSLNNKPILVRAAESSGRTRIVFETDAKEDFKISYDKENEIIMVLTKQNIAAAQLDMIVKSSSQITEHSLTKENDGNILAFTTQNVSEITKGYHLLPEAAGEKHRFYFDVLK